MSPPSNGQAPNPAMLLNPKAYKKQLSESNGRARHQAAPGKGSHLDPRSLLNPKGYPSPYLNGAVSAASVNGSKTGKRSSPKANPLEEVYGVEERTGPRQKRVRIESESIGQANGRKATFSDSSNGIIGAYMKERLEDPQRHESIDLTKDAADDEIIITGTRTVPPEGKYTPMELEEVCLGRIDIRVNAFKIPSPRAKSIFIDDKSWPSLSCELRRTPSAQDKRITVLDPTHREFGTVQADMAPVLTAIMDQPQMNVRFQPRTLTRTRKPGELPGQATSQVLMLFSNIYCPRKHAELIGRHLGGNNIWLSAPFNPDIQRPVFNPHDLLRNKGMAPSSKSGSNSYSQNRTVEEATDAVTKMFDSLSTTTQNLPEMEPNTSISTPLLPHQKKALYFLTEKEKPRKFGSEEKDNSSLWRFRYKPNGQKIYYEIISGTEQVEEPAEVLGGILADMMGLGKTIEMLALMVSTKSQAEEFAWSPLAQPSNSWFKFSCNSKATLLIAPLSTIQNWESQVRDHIRPGELSTYIYHGSNRTPNEIDLATKYDLVVTTYGTVLSDSTKQGSNFTGGPLFRVKWFRIVLDEAHTIRESKTNQSKAIYRLWATRRWAVTGTPIQNKIEDLGSLLFFLQLYPYNSPHGFAQYVKNPLRSKRAAVVTSLRVLIDSICLRRLKESINLTDRTDQVVKLDFTPNEARLHDFFKRESKAKVDNAKQREKGNAKYLTVLQGILTLRMISAHGRELLNERDRQRLKGLYKTEAIDLDDENQVRPTVMEQSAYETVVLMREAGMDNCRQCNRRLSDESPREEETNGLCGYVFSCYDLVCKDCFQSMYQAFENAFEIEENLPCPVCQLSIQPKYIPITGKGIEDFQLSQESSASSSKPKRNSNNYSGPSTKTRALLNDISEMHLESVPLLEKGEAPVKCVVFSEFTSHLDLIERALTDNNYTYTRIDGTMSLSSRRTVLNSFTTDNNITVLLASIKAAGQGLNLTAASRAFIMEPLWNPAAEQQAVDRVHRLGQTRKVQVIRYVINGSIEESIVELQRKKQMLADVSLNRERGTSRKETREEMGKLLEGLFG